MYDDDPSSFFFLHWLDVTTSSGRSLDHQKNPTLLDDDAPLDRRDSVTWRCNHTKTLPVYPYFLKGNKTNTTDLTVAPGL